MNSLLIIELEHQFLLFFFNKILKILPCFRRFLQIFFLEGFSRHHFSLRVPLCVFCFPFNFIAFNTSMFLGRISSFQYCNVVSPTMSLQACPKEISFNFVMSSLVYLTTKLERTLDAQAMVAILTNVEHKILYLL